jgi:hypothetical protein
MNAELDDLLDLFRDFVREDDERRHEVRAKIVNSFSETVKSHDKLAVDYEKLQYLFGETTGDVLEFVIENEGAMEHAIFIKLVGMLRAPEAAK